MADGRGPTELTIEELAEQGGAPVRTIRFYISEGLLPGPGSRGKAAVYGEEHLLRLRLIRRLAEQRVPLAEQRERLADLSIEEIRALLEAEDRRSTALEQARTAPSPLEYVAGLLDRARAARGPGAIAPRPSVSSPAPPPASAPSGPAPGLPAAAPARPAPGLPAPAAPAPSEPAPEGTWPADPDAARWGEPADPWAAPADTWRRWELAPGVELHVRADAASRHAKLIARLLQVAGALKVRPRR